MTESGDFDRDRDPVLDVIRGQMLMRETELVENLLSLELDSAIRDLRDMPAWKALVARLQTVEAGEITRMLKQTPTLYDLGRRQGLILALRMVTASKPLEPAEVDKAKRRVQTLQEQITADRNALE